MHRLAPISMLALALCACGGSREPGKAQAAKSVAPVAARYPAAEFVVGQGASESGPRVAEAEARRAVAEQLASTLRSRFSADMREVDGQSTASVQSRVEVEAAFDRAELIRVDPRDTRCEGRHCTAVATLRRDEAAAALKPDYDAARTDVRAACAPEAPTASPDDPVRLTRALRRAEAGFPTLARRGRVLAAVLGSPYAPLAEDRACLEALRGRVQTSARETPVWVDVTGVDDAEARARLGVGLAAGLAALGLRAATGERCDAGLRLAVSGRLSCAAGPLGPQCALPLAAALRSCAGAALADVPLGPPASGVHPRAEDRARAALYDQLTPAALQTTLRAALADTLPVSP
jgi:hypothetical protein